MSASKENAALVGAGVAACAVCCAGPILGFLAALGIASVAGALVLGLIGVAIVVVAGLLLLARRKRRQAACAAPVEQPVMIRVPRQPSA